MAEITEFTIENITKMITAIRGDDRNEKKHALSNLHNIAKALGPERTRDELIPYTIEASDYDEEEYDTGNPEKKQEHDLREMADMLSSLPDNMRMLVQDALKQRRG